MTRNLFFALLLACFTYFSGHAGIYDVYINEVNSTGKWIEMYNSGESEVNISGYILQRNNNDTKTSSTVIPGGSIIAPKGFLVLYRAEGTISPIEGAIDCLPYGISSSKFKSVVLRDFIGTIYDTFDIGNPQQVKVVRDQSWARETDGASKIVAKNPTPARPNTSLPPHSYLKIYINEVNSTGKWIEIYNDEETEVNVGGYVITRNNNDDAVGNAAIPAGTIIAPKDFLVLYRGPVSSEISFPSPVEGAIDCLPFGISSTKFEGAFLKDPQGKVVDNTFYVGDPQEVVVAKGQSWARKTDGNDKIMSLNQTPGQPNDSPPLFSELNIYINEVNAAGNWIELYNDEDEEVNVGGYIFIRVNNDEAAGIAAIPTGTTIAPKGFLVLYQGPASSETSPSPSPVAGAIDCLTFGISLTKFESVALKDAQGYFVGNTFHIGDPQEVIALEEQSWARIFDGSPDINAKDPTPGVSNGKFDSISELKAKNTLASVYAGILNLPENTSNVQLYGASGNLVLEQNVTENSIDLSNLPKGFYLVKLTVSGILYIQKIIVY